MLQLEAEGYFTGIYRPIKIPKSPEAVLNTDARFKSFNKHLITSLEPTIVDVKCPIDKAAKLARGEYDAPGLDAQMTDIVNSIKFQRERAEKKKEVVVHAVNFIRIRPADRILAIALFRSKAEYIGINVDSVILLNTSPHSIY